MNMLQPKIAKLGIILLIAATFSALTNMPLFNQTANAQMRQPNSLIQPIAGQILSIPVPGALTNQWWDWIFSLDTVKIGGNPVLDKTGALCNAGLQRNGMLFLVGTGGITIPSGKPIQEDTSYQRTCTTPIRQGTSILIPIVNSECSPIEFGYNENCNQQPGPLPKTAPPCPQSQVTYAAALRSEVNKLINHATRLNIAVDGVPLTPQRAQSPGLGHCTTIMPNNPFAAFGTQDVNPLNVAQPTTVQSIADGYWALITNLPRGQHTLEFGGTIGPFIDGSSFVTKATYHLTVS
jgi:hypothetical protein